jgi:dihydrofolate reductase
MIIPMSQIRLYIAASLDGFIARTDGSIDWLTALPNPDGNDYGYGDFYAGIDTVVMGRRTYEEVLGFGVPWPYPECRTWVASSQTGYPVSTPNTLLLPAIDAASVEGLRAGSTRGIWIVGGGEVIRAFLRLGTVDEMLLCTIPLILGGGIPLFPSGTPEYRWHLTGTEAYRSGAVKLKFRKAGDAEFG